MGRFRDRENYENYERENFDRDSYSWNSHERNDRSKDNNFDRIYDSREYSREDNRRFYERDGYSRDYAQNDMRYQPQERQVQEPPQRDYRGSRYARFEESPARNDDYYDKYPRENEGVRPSMQKDNRVVICSPKSYQDIQNLIDSLKKKQSLIVDVSELDSKDTQRYLDFLSGAIYALNGSYQKIDSKKFYFAPQGVSITIPFDLKQKKE